MPLKGIHILNIFHNILKYFIYIYPPLLLIVCSLAELVDILCLLILRDLQYLSLVRSVY